MRIKKKILGHRSGIGTLRRYGTIFLTAIVLTSACGTSCYAAENAAEEEGPEPAPGTGGLEGEGMLSPSEGSSGNSVFGGNSVPEEDSNAGMLTDEKLQTILQNVQAGFPTGNGSWAVYISDLTKNSEGSVNSHAMQAASLIKLYIMGAIYDNYDNIIVQYGQNSVDSNLRSMITVSDNDAANTLVSYLGSGDSSAGMSAVNNFCQIHGYTDTSMGRLLLQSNANGDNYTSVSDCGRFLRAVYEGKAAASAEEDASKNAGDVGKSTDTSQDFSHASDMFELLAGQQRRNKIPAQMPAGVSVANKTGELSNVENDAGIIYNTSNDVVIVFMSEGLGEAGAAQSSIASLSRQIYDYYNN